KVHHRSEAAPNGAQAPARPARAGVAGRRGRGDDGVCTRWSRVLADGGPGDGYIGRLHEPAVLRHQADHARRARRLRHQRLVAGTMWANWMVKLLDGKGNIVFLGGPAGNPVTSGRLKSIVKVFAKHPGMKLLTGKKTWPVTNWDPATAQKQMSALLAKYKKID